MLRGWKKIVEEQEAGRRPINRARSWQEATRTEKKEQEKTSWYKAGGFSTVIFCPGTPGSELADKWRQLDARSGYTRGWRYNVVELEGRQVRSLVCSLQPTAYSVSPAETEG